MPTWRLFQLALLQIVVAEIEDASARRRPVTVRLEHDCSIVEVSWSDARQHVNARRAQATRFSTHTARRLIVRNKHKGWRSGIRDAVKSERETISNADPT